VPSSASRACARWSNLRFEDHIHHLVFFGVWIVVGLHLLPQLGEWFHQIFNFVFLDL
jgi:hypothetical protein